MTLRDRLAQTVAMMETMGHPALIERFVLRNGKDMAVKAWPDRHPARECFANASSLVIRSRGALYVEGYGMRADIGFPIHHAWFKTGDNAYDPTWRDPEQCEYIGVEFSEAQLLAQLRKNGVYGLLDIGMINITFMLEIDPGLAAFVPTRAMPVRRVY